ncbi:phospholipase A and acyltransferase 3 [Aplysia californica]|uniref:Phospholipase A and acyltransferase 3 n=1 Tax=Aplysia californica TaxID=6500 RepID=A0ABM1AG17_APLCA|nr:phospholipase A and acyltransferase 3 [Aplysia californica]
MSFFSGSSSLSSASSSSRSAAVFSSLPAATPPSKEDKAHNLKVLKSLSPGDRVEFKRGVFSHWGLYIGDEKIIHVTGPEPEQAEVRIDKFLDVVQDGRAEKNNSKDEEWNPLAVGEIIKRAKQRLGKVQYSLLSNNCEHFVNWCRYGKSESDQVNKVMNTLFFPLPYSSLTSQ